MRRYRICHTTQFTYDQPAVASYNELRMLPLRDENQVVFSSKIDTSPSGANFEFNDFFETRVLFFEALEPHLELIVKAESLVELRGESPDIEPMDWERLEGVKLQELELVDFLKQTRRTQPPAELARFATRSRDLATPNEAAIHICRHIFKTMKYETGVTGVNSIASEAWRMGVGVCQDFAHLAIGALRQIGIPARYVSGYLHPKLEPKLHETVLGESHAWVEWFAGSWVAFDPTNDVAVSNRHVTVGRGRDYDDIPPMRGVFAGANTSTLSVEVEITREL